MSSFAEIEMEIVRLSERIDMQKLDKALLAANILRDATDVMHLQVLGKDVSNKIGDVAIDLIVLCLAHDINLTDCLYAAHSRNLQLIASQSIQ